MEKRQQSLIKIQLLLRKKIKTSMTKEKIKSAFIVACEVIKSLMSEVCVRRVNFSLEAFNESAKVRDKPEICLPSLL